MANLAAVGDCAICGREETLTRHHLIPRTRHYNKRNKREFERAVVRQVVGICPPAMGKFISSYPRRNLSVNTTRLRS